MPTSPASIAARVAILDNLEECRGDAPSSERNRVEDGFLSAIFVYEPMFTATQSTYLRSARWNFLVRASSSSAEI
jgi:hypothetical protein